MKIYFNSYIKTHFPQSNLNASFCEVWADYELRISTWLRDKTYTSQDLERVTSLAIQIFEDMFMGETEPVWALINQWDTRRDIYTFNQFKGLNEANYEAWVFFDETHQEDREQIIIKTTLDNINYQNIIRKAIYRCQNWKDREISSRVYFIHPIRHMYYLHFDSEVILGSDDAIDLVGYYHKYYQYMEDVRRKAFQQYIVY